MSSYHVTVTRVEVTDRVSGSRRIEAGRSAALPQSAVADVLGLPQQRVAQPARVS